MTKLYSGGCACGSVRYDVTGEPIVMNDCQCRQCQHDSGTGHSSYLLFSDAHIDLTGQVTRWESVGDNGTRKSRAFCPTCGSPVYLTFPSMPNLFVATAGSLDDPARYKPQFVTWSAAGLDWDHIEPSLARFEKMPPQ